MPANETETDDTADEETPGPGVRACPRGECDWGASHAGARHYEYCPLCGTALDGGEGA